MKEFMHLVQQCADAGKMLAQTQVNEGNMRELSLYCLPSKPSKGPGQLLLIAEENAPLNCVKVCEDTLKCNVPFDTYYQWIYARSKRAPVMSH